MGKCQIAIILEIVNRMVKQSEFWDSGVQVEYIYGLYLTL